MHPADAEQEEGDRGDDVGDGSGERGPRLEGSGGTDRVEVMVDATNVAQATTTEPVRQSGALRDGLENTTRPSGSSRRAARLGAVTVLESGRWHMPMGARPAARIIAVRGRPGVGKSTVAANLAIALAQMRSRVVLIDLDVVRPALHRLFGVPARVAGLQALLAAQVDTIEQALTPTGVRNLHLVSGEGTVPCSSPAAPDQQHRLLEQIWELDADVIVADVGTDPAHDLVDLQALGALSVAVAAPDRRSIRAAYGLFRQAVMRDIEHVAGGTAEGAMLVASLADRAPAPMRDLLATLAPSPQVRGAIEQVLAAFGGRLVGNRTRNPAEADVLHATSRLIRDYLGVSIPVLGVIDASDKVRASSAGRPLLLGPGLDRNVHQFHAMAEQLLVDEVELEAARCLTAPAPAYRLAGSHALDDEPPLPTALGPYMRRHPRHSVDWYALFQAEDGRRTAVRVFEVSLVGACIQTLPGLQAGVEGELIFAQLPGQPTVRVRVAGVRPRLGRAGLRIDGPEEIALALVQMAASTAEGGAASEATPGTPPATIADM